MPKVAGASAANLPKHQSAQRTKKEAALERQKAERARLAEGQRKPPMRAGAGSHLEKQRSQNQPPQARSPNKYMRSPKSKKAPKVPEEPSGPSRYLDKLLCLNFISMVHKYDQFVAPKKRVEALTTTKKELARRFMKLYKTFRCKKYGEPLNEE